MKGEGRHGDQQAAPPTSNTGSRALSPASARTPRASSVLLQAPQHAPRELGSPALSARQWGSLSLIPSHRLALELRRQTCPQGREAVGGVRVSCPVSKGCRVSQPGLCQPSSPHSALACPTAVLPRKPSLLLGPLP
ncbi:hypothetical protein GH733_017781 [Mirounga leonina]|nr:hypothetical protein GH733_017781 [Mirounga leonina]